MQKNLFQKNITSFLQHTLCSNSNSFESLVHEYNLKKGCVDYDKYFKTFLVKEKLPFPTFVIPKIYQTLPRLYSHDDKRKFFLKEGFDDLKQLELCFIDRFISYCYHNVSFPKVNITLFTYVLPDGLGDLYCQYKIASLLKKKFPQINISLVLLLDNSTSLPKEKSKYTMFAHRYKWKKKIKKQVLSKEIMDVLASSDLIFQVPTSYPHMPSLLTEITNKKKNIMYVAMGEYGFIGSREFNPNHLKRSMGLHFLEQGIIIDESKKSGLRKLSDIKNSKLKTKLFSTSKPTTSILNNYKKSTRLFLFYLLNETATEIFLCMLLKYLENDKKNIDLCSGNISCFLKLLKKKSLFKDFKIKKIIVLVKEGKFSIDLNDSGKILRFIVVDRLSLEDFSYLFGLSDNIIGCRGNQSISEAISQNKIFFYDGAGHNKAFFKDLVELAKNRLSKYPSAIKYLELQLSLIPEPYKGKWVEKEFFQHHQINIKKISIHLGQLLQNKKTILGLNKLNKIIQKENRANENICNLIARFTMHSLYKKIRLEEEKYLNEYLSNKINFQDLISQIKGLVKNYEKK